MEAPWNSLFSLYLVRLIQIPALVALILCIVGATSTDDPATIYSETTLQVGVILFAVVLVALMLLSAAAAIGYRKTGRGERQLVIALCVSLPLLMIRVIYSIVSCFGSHAPGSILASATKGEFLQIFLANIEEMAVTVIYICAGLKMPSVPTAAGDNGRGQGPGKRVEERFKRGDFGGGRLGLISLVVELVSGVFRERNARGQQAGNGRDQQAQNHALAKERYDRY